MVADSVFSNWTKTPGQSVWLAASWEIRRSEQACSVGGRKCQSVLSAARIQTHCAKKHDNERKESGRLPNRELRADPSASFNRERLQHGNAHMERRLAHKSSASGEETDVVGAEAARQQA